MRQQINRSMARVVAFALSGLVVCLGCNREGPGRLEQPAGIPIDGPDVVVVVMDTVRADHLGVYGYPRATSPSLDALANEGVWYSRAYAHSGWTLPSFASLLTGELPHEHRVGRDPANPSKFGRLSAETTTLAEQLQAAGYATAAFVNNTFLAPEFGLNQGFSLYDYKGARNDEHRSSKETVRLALDWIQGRSEPIFLLVHFMEPHPYYDPPAEVRGAFSGLDNTKPEQPVEDADYVRWVMGRSEPTPEQLNRLMALYDEEILAADKALGLLAEGLQARQRWGETLLVVTADHGEEFWDHGRFEHGHDLHGELTRVPLVIVGKDVGQGEVRDVVDHRRLSRWITARVGIGSSEPVKALSAPLDGEEADSRTSVSENILRGRPLASVVDKDYRFLYEIQTGTSELWKVDALGAELDLVPADEERQHKERLLAILQQLRGDLRPVLVDGPEFPTPAVFEQLRTLGYIR